MLLGRRHPPSTSLAVLLLPLLLLLIHGAPSASGQACVTAQGRCRLQLRGHTDWIMAVAYSPDGTRIATCSNSGDGSVRIWDAQTGAAVWVWNDYAGMNCGSVAFSPDGTRVATAHRNEGPGGIGGTGAAYLWDLQTGRQTTTLAEAGPVRSLAFSPDGSRLAAGTSDSTLHLYDPRNGERLRTTSTNGTVSYVAYSPDGTTLAIACAVAAVLDANTLTEIARFTRHTRWVSEVAFLSDTTVASAGATTPQAVQVWAARDPSTLRYEVSDGIGAYPNALAVSSDGVLLAAGASTPVSPINIWDAARGILLANLTEHFQGVYGMAFSPDGASLVTGGTDSTAVVWDVTGIAPPEETAAPNTSAPDTEAPAVTAAPAFTLSPATGGAVEAAGSVTTAAMTTTAVAAGALGGSIGSGTSRVARTQMYAKMLDCPRQGTEAMPWAISPTQLTLGKDDIREVRGAAVGNAALLLSTGSLLVMGAAAHSAIAGNYDFWASLATVPTPLWFFLLELLWTPTVQGAVAVLLHGRGDAADILTGCVVGLACLITLACLLHQTRQAKARHATVAVLPKRPLDKYVGARYLWKPIGERAGEVAYLYCIFDGFRREHCGFFAVQLVCSGFVGVLAGWNPQNLVSCAGRAGVLTCIPLFWTAILLKDLPFSRQIENASEVILSGLEFVFAALGFWGTAQEDNALLAASGALVAALGYCALAKFALGVALYARERCNDKADYGTFTPDAVAKAEEAEAAVEQACGSSGNDTPIFSFRPSAAQPLIGSDARGWGESEEMCLLANTAQSGELAALRKERDDLKEQVGQLEAMSLDRCVQV